MFRVVVQESRLTPTSGKVIARLGSYDPHTKAATLEKEKAGFYLEHGAQPSERAAALLQKEGVKLPGWVKLTAAKRQTTRHPDKLRRNKPAAEATPAADEAPTGEEAAEAAPATVDTAPEPEKT